MDLEFLKEIFSDWWSGMSGAFSIPFVTLGAFNVWNQKDLFYILAIVALGITTYRLWSKERKKVDELDKKYKGKTRFDLFLDFLDKKAIEDIDSSRFPSFAHAVVNWHNKIENGLKLFFGDKQIDNVIALINRDISSRVTGFPIFNYDEVHAKTTLDKCRQYVREIKKHINPTMMSKDFEPLDLDK